MASFVSSQLDVCHWENPAQQSSCSRTASAYVGSHTCLSWVACFVFGLGNHAVQRREHQKSAGAIRARAFQPEIC
jgi:hypothetical protein